MNEEIIMIPIDRIRILNPRHRDPKKFELIVQSIKNLGLKKPIQVNSGGDGGIIPGVNGWRGVLEMIIAGDGGCAGRGNGRNE